MNTKNEKKIPIPAEMIDLLEKYYVKILGEFRITPNEDNEIKIYINDSASHPGTQFIQSNIIQYSNQKFQFEFEYLSEEHIIENRIIEQLCSYLENSTTFPISNDNLKENNKSKNNRDFIEQVYYNINEYLLTVFYLSVDCINILSGKTHEKAECSGWLCFSPSFKSENIVMPLKKSKTDQNGILDIIFDLQDIRMLRRLVETTKSNRNVCLGLQLIFGNQLNTEIFEEQYKVIGYVKQNINGKLYINIIAPLKWELWLGEEKLLIYNKGQYYKEDNNKIVFSNESIINKINNLEDPLKRYIDAIKKSPKFHGALLIFTDNDKYIQKMAENNRAIEISYSQSLSKVFSSKTTNFKDSIVELFVNLCMIDGAVVFNLDNKQKNTNISKKQEEEVDKNDTLENKSHGSRYNSAKTFIQYYTNSDTYQYFAVVLSEDGEIYYIP